MKLFPNNFRKQTKKKSVWGSPWWREIDFYETATCWFVSGNTQALQSPAEFPQLLMLRQWERGGFPPPGKQSSLAVEAWALQVDCGIWVPFLFLVVPEKKRHISEPRFSHLLLLFSRSVISDSLWQRGLQLARLHCPSPSPGTCSNSCSLGWWCPPTISSSVVPFSFCLQSFPVLGSFPMSQLFTSGGQSIGVSASALVLPMNIQDWSPLGSPLGLDLLAVQRTLNSLLQYHSSKHQFFGTQPSLWSNSHIHTWLLEKPQLWRKEWQTTLISLLQEYHKQYQKAKRTTIRPSSSTPGYIFEKTQNINLKRPVYPSVHGGLMYTC